MIRFVTVLSLALLAVAASASAQVLTPITAREPLARVTSQAKNDLGGDAVVTNVLFARLEYQSVALSIDLATGKATGWVYRAYAPSRDSSLMYVAVSLPLLGLQVVAVPVDTISQLIPGNVSTIGLIEPWIDSPAAIAGSKSGGAEAFLTAHPDARLALAAVVNNPVANPLIPLGEYWILRYVATADTLTCLVFADSGTPLRCVSNNAPVFVSIPVTLARAGETYTYDVDAVGTPPPLYTLVTAPTGMSIDEASGVITWIPTAQQVGSAAVVVRAANANGTSEQNFTVLVQPSASAPKIQSTPPVEVIAGETYMYQVFASGAPAPTYSLDTAPAGMTVDPGRGVVIWTPSRAQAGTHAVTLRATNAAGADTQSWDLAVLAAPRLALIPDQTAEAGRTFTLRAVAEGHPAPRFALPLAPTGMTIDADSGIVTWSPTTGDIGAHPVRLEARNKAGAQEQSFTVTVTSPTSVDAPPVADVQSITLHPQPLRTGTHDALAIAWQQLRAGSVRAIVRDLLGRTLRVLDAGLRAPGAQMLVWDVCDAHGARVVPGLYHLQLATSGGSLLLPLVVTR